jgi:hypothetical protein
LFGMLMSYGKYKFMPKAFGKKILSELLSVISYAFI